MAPLSRDIRAVLADNAAFIRARTALTNTVRDGLDCETAALCRAGTSTPPTPDEAARLYADIHGTDAPSMRSPDFARFCRALSEAYDQRLMPGTDAEPIPLSPKVAYLQNTFSDRAYSRFAATLDDRTTRLSAVYYPGFREVCEEVYNGGAHYAMLPIYSSRDGQLLSFRRLLSKYDLKIAHVTDIEMNDDSVMRYALLQKGLDSTMKRTRRYLELSIVSEQAEYGQILSACETLGAVVLMMHSLPLEYADDRCVLTLQLDMVHAARDAFFFFLEGSYIRYEPVGMYDIIHA